MKRLVISVLLVFCFVPFLSAQDSDTLYFLVYTQVKKQIIVSKPFMVADIGGPEWNQPIIAALKKDFANLVAQEVKANSKSVLENTEMVSSWDQQEVKDRYSELRGNARKGEKEFQPFPQFKPLVLPGTDMEVLKSN